MTANNAALPWIGSGSRAVSPGPQQTISPRGPHATTETGMEFVGSVSSDIHRMGGDVAYLQTAVDRLRGDLETEARVRGGELGAHAHKHSSDLADVVTRLRYELEARIDAFENKSTSWVRTLGQEIKGLKPRLESLEQVLPSHTTAHAVTEGRLANMEKVVPAVQRDLAGIDEKHGSKISLVEAQLGTHRDQSGSTMRALAANNAQEIKRLEEQMEDARQQHNMTKNTLQAHYSTMDALNEKLVSLQQVLGTRARVDDVNALELKLHATLDTTAKALSEELDRKESVATVKAVSDRITNVMMDVHAHAEKAKSQDEHVSRQTAELDQNISKVVRQMDSDREAANTCMVSLGRELQTKAHKAEVEVLPGRLASVEMKVAPLADMIASKAGHDDVAKLHSRSLMLEEGIATRAHMDELPRLHMALAEHKARHDARHAEYEAHRVEHAGKLDRHRSIEDEHRTRLEVAEYHQRELHAQLLQKAEAESVLTKEFTSQMLREYYRREEIDAMMTRVWWRVGDTSMSPKGKLPSLPHALKK